MKVLWTEQAFSRLAEIEDFVSTDNPAAAVKLIPRLVDRGESLARLSHRGRRLPEMPSSPLRELVEGNSKDIGASAVRTSHRPFTPRRRTNSATDSARAPPPITN